MAGGYAGDFQSGKVDNSGKKNSDDAKEPWAVYNIDTVTGGSYAGGFGGKVHSGALADAGKGLNILGGLGEKLHTENLSIDITQLASIAAAYVPYITAAGVKSGAETVEQTSGRMTSDPKNPGLVVSALRLDTLDSQSGSAGGFIGYGSGVQVSNSDVTQLRYTKVTEPKQLEGVDGSTYFDEPQSAYAITAKRYAGGYIGKMDIGSAASVGGGLKVLNVINLADITKVLSVVVSTIEHSDVTGAASGYSVLASDTSEENTNHGDGIATEGSAKNPLGEAGGFAGRVMGGHVQDSNAHNFAYIIGQITAGGYAGGIAPGDVASVLGSDMTILNGLINTGGTFASLLQDFVPTIRNSSTDAVPCGAAVRAQAASDEYVLRGMAGGYVGHDEGGHIWGNNNAPWKSENDDHNHYNGEKRTAYAARIRSVYGAEFAGGFTGFMQAASTAKTGSLSLLFGLISVDNLLGALGVAYPTDENTKVTGPLHNLDIKTWKDWVKSVGLTGAYGKEFAELLEHADQITTQDDLNKAFATYVYGTNVVAGRTVYTQNANESQGGVAGGYVGLMRAGTVTNGQASDTKLVKAMRAAGGFAGAMESGGAVEFGNANVLNIIKLNLSKLVSALNVFVPVVKSSSVTGYRRGMTVEATGTDLTHANGFAGGYVGYASGAQIWGDKTFDDAEKTDNRWTIGSTHEGYSATGCNVTNLRRVKGTNAIGGYAGLITAAGVADVNTNASEGILQKLLDALISTPNDLAQVVQATVSTVRGAKVTSVKDDQAAAAWGFTVEGAYSVTGADGKTATKYARAAGGFAGSMKAVVAGTEKGGASDTDTLTVDGLRSVEGGQYAGGFFGQADVTAVASIAGTDGTDGSDQSTELLLKLIKAGNISALEAFRTFIHHANVNGVADGIQVKAHDASQQGILNSKQYTGAAGGFGGGLINGTVDYGKVTNLNSVNGVNYAGGFVGHLGKAGTVDVNNAEVAKLLGATAGVLDIWGSHVDDSSVSGIADGFTVAVSHDGVDYQAGTDAATGREVAGGFAGYADLARISRSTVTGLKKVSSGELAGGFVGETTMAYLVDAEISSVLLDFILKVVNALLKLLYLNKAEDLGVIDLGKWFPALGKVIDLKVLAEGELLYVNLFGLKIGVALSRADAENQQQEDVAIITIGDSTIKLPCTKDGGVDENQLRSNLTVELIKANRTKVTYSSVQGIADGYDVFGGGATQESDGTKDLKTGYAGGFVALNDEGLFEHDDMTYADMIRGTADLVGPFSGMTKLKSSYNFNDVYDIEGNTNTYHIYRDVPSSWSYALTADKKQFTYGSHMDNVTDKDGQAIDVTGALKLNLNRYDVAHLANKQNQWGEPVVTPYIKQFADYKDALVSNNVGGVNDPDENGAKKSKFMNVYVSAAEAVLMLNVAVTDNTSGLTPEPDDGQDPCGLDGCQAINLTLRKVWDDNGGRTAERPKSITLRITATYTDANGKIVTPANIYCPTDDCATGSAPETGTGSYTKQGNPWNVTLSADDASDGNSNTWRKVVKNLPIAVQDKDGTIHPYTYTVQEIAVTYQGKDPVRDYDKTPTDAGYHVTVAYDTKEYVATVTNSPWKMPDTGSSGTQWIAMLAVIVLGLGTAWYLREAGVVGARRRRGRHHAS
ncbi:Cna B-type domain-containing protein [Bifidobacterium amazonense]|uniref:Cna B-type domain-containing protein n=1 Tax=Bifidobacterium amazonense TaxID=2809027 RepID=A0ABS9VX48_9BIFI|nr:Cna B-type domain-containing protein [Bifidobacterium amazonense]MCH9276662.1 Cna B-type domain-containing protein [Bifidobacterium amazonense]